MDRLPVAWALGVEKASKCEKFFYLLLIHIDSLTQSIIIACVGNVA